MVYYKRPSSFNEKSSLYLFRSDFLLLSSAVLIRILRCLWFIINKLFTLQFFTTEFVQNVRNSVNMFIYWGSVTKSGCSNRKKKVMIVLPSIYRICYVKSQKYEYSCFFYLMLTLFLISFLINVLKITDPLRYVK